MYKVTCGEEGGGKISIRHLPFFSRQDGFKLSKCYYKVETTS